MFPTTIFFALILIRLTAGMKAETRCMAIRATAILNNNLYRNNYTLAAPAHLIIVLLLELKRES